MQEPVSPIQITLPVRQLVEFLRRAGSIDNRFTGFDRANEGARIHRKLQRAAVKEHADYAAEVFLRGIFAYEEIEFTLEGRADGIFTAADGVTVVDEIKTTACPAADITPDFAPEHWAQAIVYAAIYAAQHELEEMRVQLTYFQVDEELILRFERHYTAQQLQEEVEALLAEYAPWARRVSGKRPGTRICRPCSSLSLRIAPGSARWRARYTKCAGTAAGFCARHQPGLVNL